MNRRKFLFNSSAFALPLLVNGLSFRALAGSVLPLHINNDSNDRVLVLIQLFGGNDGLNTVIPIDQYSNYIKARPNIAIDENKILKLPRFENAGFHPSLTGMQQLLADDKLAIIQSVGYPQPNFSHFTSTDIWMSCINGDLKEPSGWAGRYLEKVYSGYPDNYPNEAMPDPPAIQVGQVASLIFRGGRSLLSLNISDAETTYILDKGFTDAARHSNSGEALTYIRQLAQQTQVYSKVVKAADNTSQQLEYPDTKLARQLKTVARLIKGGLKTKLYLVSAESFDHHADQVTKNDSSTGIHADLLNMVDKAIAAFQKDLEFLKIDDRVLGMTFSEFGRRIVSNDSLGTDHGTAAPLFLFGSKVNAGIIGKNPVIPLNATSEDNIEMQTDFRSVYSSVLCNWLNMPKSDLADVLFKEYPLLPIIKSA